MSTKTRFILTKEMVLEHVDTIGHGKHRSGDTAKAADGALSPPSPPITVKLEQARRVQSITVQKDADGNLHIVLQD